MRSFFSFIVAGLVLYVASLLFPEVVIIGSFGKLVMATILICAIAILLLLFLVLILSIILMLARPFLLVIFAIIAMFVSLVAGVAAASALINGFEVVGFWPQVLLALFIGATTVSINYDAKADSRKEKRAGVGSFGDDDPFDEDNF